jgi:hypothetical protein
MKHALFAFAALIPALVACGSSTDRSTPTAPAPSASASATTTAAVAPSTRTMVHRGLLGGSAIASLVLDPTFDTGSPGIGRWRFAAGQATPTVTQQAVLSDSPFGVGLTAGVVSDVRAPGQGSPSAVSLTAEIPGGAGPFHVGLWISVDAIENESSPPTLVKVSLVQAYATKGTPAAVDVPNDPTATRVIGTRTWWRFEGDAPGPNAIGSFFLIRLRASKYRWYLQAPEVVPAPLASTKWLELAKRVRVADAEELALVADYRAQPFPRVPPSELPKRTRAFP